jgi:hypothetical protein
MKILTSLILLFSSCCLSLPGAEEAEPKTPRTGLFDQEILFEPLLADPRNPSYSLGLRFGDEAYDEYAYTSSGAWTGVVGENRIFWTFSFGDRIGIYLWDDLFGGKLKISLEGGAWSIFALRFAGPPEDNFTRMINIDFRIGVPVTWSNGTLSWKVSIYHQSSHLGDELMRRMELYLQPSRRLNPSNEVVDAAVSWRIVHQARVYILLGVFISTDDTFPIAPLFIEWGGEFRPWKNLKAGGGAYWEPYMGVHVRNWQEYGFLFDCTFALGVEIIPRNPAVKYNFRFAGEYHHGYSLEGQFSTNPTDYFGVAFSAGF